MSTPPMLHTGAWSTFTFSSVPIPVLDSISSVSALLSLWHCRVMLISLLSSSSSQSVVEHDVCIEFKHTFQIRQAVCHASRSHPV